MATPSRHRLHPISPLFAVAARLRGLVIPAVVVIFAARSTAWSTWETWLLLLSVPLSVAGIWRYFTTRYAFADEEMIVWSGLIFRNERHVKYARIQNIETARNPFHRMFGVVEVRLQTAGGTEPEASLRVLSTAALEELRRHVFEGRRRAGVVDAGAETAASESDGTAAETRVLVHLGVRDVIAFGLIDNRGMVVMAALFGVLWETGLFDIEEVPSFSILESFWKSIIGAGLGFQRWSPAQFALLAAGLVGVLAVVRVMSVSWALFRLWGFTLEKHGNELRSTSGFFTRVHGTVPLHRVQLVTVGESPLQRRFGKVSVRVQTAGGTEENPSVTREWLAPILPRADLDRLVGEVLSGTALSGLGWEPVDGHARWRLFREWMWVTVVISFIAARIDGGFGWVVLAAMALLSWFAARGQARGFGYAVGHGHVARRAGWLWRHMSVAPFEKIQVTRLHRSPIDRRWSMASLAADTAGGGSHRIDIPYLPDPTADALFTRLRAAAGRTRFRW